MISWDKMDEQQTLGFDYDQPARANSGQVICLGITFENDEERRNYFTEKLREKLQDSELRKIEGFPIGSDEDILALSDPPYYTACPNPWIADFVKEWESQKPEKLADYKYHREPFAADVSEGKNDPIYNAHSYHTKVPHKAIMQYILHYTEPGDIVFDGFCGTGMTGVAAQMCGDRKTVESLGYQVQPDGTILKKETDEDGKNPRLVSFSKLGARRAVLNDLSPAATFIAYNYNTRVDVKAFEREAKRILKEIEREYSWMYETKLSDGQIGKINYTVWSDVFVCPECATELNLWEQSVNKEEKQVQEVFHCPTCGVEVSKKNMERSWVTEFDTFTNKTVKVAKQIPALINYSVGNKRDFKKPDKEDLLLIDKINKIQSSLNAPTDELPDGFNTRQPKISHGVDRVHLFFTKRNLLLVLAIRNKINHDISIRSALLFWINAANRNLSRLSKLGTGNYFGGGGGAVNAGILGTLYLPSFSVESSVIKMMNDRLPKLARVLSQLGNSLNLITTQSSTSTMLKEESLDYIFVDPPFGSNINYSELNFLWEAWLGPKTNNKEEAIENSIQQKSLDEYRQLMALCFKEAYRLLKPGHWMTVEFSNTKASVWNSIQISLAEAGFLVANVSALDKKLGSFKAVTTPTAVKQDLVISAYKPNGGFEKRFQKEATTEEGVWDFVRTHLDYLPVIKSQGALLQMVPERDPRILFDQMVAYYVRKGYPVPISSQEFQIGLSNRFIERDGMYFLPEQAAEYDRKKMTKQVCQAKLFVSDETSAIQWLRQLLKEKPQTFQDINPLFMKELGGWSKNEQQLDLRELLNQNFLCYDGKSEVPSQIHSYLSTNWPEMRNLAKEDPKLVAKAKDRWYVPDPNKAGDLEKLRERALLKEFEEYKQAKKKLKVFRLEAVRAGFKKAWQERDYRTIISVAEKIPSNVLEEDPKLLMWYDQAVTRMGSE
jgi:DNA modification methylase